MSTRIRVALRCVDGSVTEVFGYSAPFLGGSIPFTVNTVRRVAALTRGESVESDYELIAALDFLGFSPLKSESDE